VCHVHKTKECTLKCKLITGYGVYQRYIKQIIEKYTMMIDDGIFWESGYNHDEESLYLIVD